MPDSQGPAPERILGFAFAYAAPLVIEAGIQHRVFDLLADGAMTAGELAGKAGVSERGARILMNALVGFDLLDKDSAGRYSLTEESDLFLVTHHPAFVGGLFRHASAQLIPKWLELNEVVARGKPLERVNREEEGAEFFEKFVEEIFPMSRPSAVALAAHLDVASATAPVRVLDIGAGSGVWGISLAEASPQVSITAVDWEVVLGVTRRVAERFGVADRLTCVPGDFEDSDFGTGHQVATIGHILHSEGEARSKALLGKVFGALAPGGTVAIAEFLVDADRKGPLRGLVFAVNMLVNTDEGDTYSFEEISEWLEEAGFENPRTLKVPSPSPLILANKPR